MTSKSDETRGAELTALRRLQKISAEMVSELELDRVLESIVEGASALLEADTAHIYRYDPDRDIMISWIPLDLPDQALAVEMARGEGGAGMVLATGESILIDDYENWERRAENWPRGLTGPTLHVPVRQGDEMLGDIGVGRKPGEDAFTEEDKDLLELFANQAAIAISNAQLYEETKRSADQFAKLYQTSLDIASAVDVDEVLEAILKRATELLSARSANLRMYEPDRNLLVPLLPYRQYGKLGQSELVPGEGVAGAVYSSRQPIAVEDYDEWEGSSSQFPSGLFDRVMGVPLSQGDEVVGVLTVERTADKPPFSEEDIRLLSLFGNQAVLAISQAQLYKEAKQRSREISHIYETSLDVTTRLDLNQVLRAVMERTMDLVDAQIGEVLVYDEERGLITDFLNIGLGDAELAEEMHKAGEPPTGLDGIVIGERQPYRIEDYDAWPERLPEMPIGLIGSMIGVPIQHQDRILGSLSLARTGEGRPFSDEDERHLMLFANQAAVAIQNARQVEELRDLHEERLAAERLSAQMQTAKAVQAGLLRRKPPDLDGWDLAVSWKPALEIGGDFYDFIDLGDGYWGLVIGDVADKGIPAAVFMSVALATVRSLAGRRQDPSDVLRNVNRELFSGSRSGNFVSAIYGVLHAGNSTLSLSMAGHNPLLIRRSESGNVESLPPSGMVLGVERQRMFETANIDLSPGDVAVFYTDGVTEAMSPNGEPFGLERLEKFFRDSVPQSARAISEALDREIREHAASAEQSDDITHVVVRAASAG